MKERLDEIKINEFCNMVFKIVDTLDHFPINLKSRDATPTRLEKYPRLLFGYLQRYDEPITALKEWESKLLRDTREDKSNKKKIDAYELLQQLELWVKENEEFFTGKEKKALIRHLRGSLYARIFGYMYPRRKVINEVVEILKQEGKDVEYGKEYFEEILESAEGSVEDLKEKIQDEWEVIVKDAKQKFCDTANYYKKVIGTKEE